MILKIKVVTSCPDLEDDASWNWRTSLSLRDWLLRLKNAIMDSQPPRLKWSVALWILWDLESETAFCWLGEFRWLSFEGFHFAGYSGLNEFVLVKYLLQSLIAYRHSIKRKSYYSTVLHTGYETPSTGSFFLSPQTSDFPLLSNPNNSVYPSFTVYPI